MKLVIFIFTMIYFTSVSSPCIGLLRPDVEFKVFQFPKDNIPKIDGNPDDWAIVPDTYSIGSEDLLDTVKNTPIDKNDLDVTVKVGWVDGLDRLYFLYEAYDNYWDFKSTNLHNDIFEIVVDGDLSGGSLLPGSDMSAWEGYLFQGVYAQNYHIFTPAEGKSWCMVWGCQPWIAEFPWANASYQYNFEHSQSGKLVLEFYITPFDYAPYSNPEQAIPSELKENKIIGLSWSILDYDDENASGYDGFYNLSHKTSMYGNASDLVAFRLVPLEEQFHEPIEAQWSWEIIDMDQRCVEFTDESYGKITSWKWDFGDGSYSTEQNPTHRYSKAGTHYIVILYVEGPEGDARMSKIWDVAIK